MRRAVWAAVATTMVVALVGTFASGAGAGTAPPIDLSDEQLEQLDDLLPAAPPAGDDLDLDDAQGLFDDMVEIVGDEGAPGGGSSLTGGCGGFALSYGPDGLLDAAIDVGDGNPPIDVLDGTQAFTSGNRFKVHSDGIVAWGGFMNPPPENHDWEYRIGGMPIDSGGDENEDLENTEAGIVDLGDTLPFGINLTTIVDGSLKAAGGNNCIGDGHIEVEGPILGPLGILGFGLTAAGAAGLAFGARPKEL